MLEFQKGQLVAVSDFIQDAYVPRVYVREDELGHLSKDIGDNLEAPGGKWWRECRPAEEVWPDIFIGKERQVAEQNICAVEMEQGLVQRLRKQIRWLCQELSKHTRGVLDCPYTVKIDEAYRCRAESCSDCWEQASLKAAKEKRHA